MAKYNLILYFNTIQRKFKAKNLKTNAVLSFPMLKKRLYPYYAILFSHNAVVQFAYFLFPLFFLEIGLNGIQSGVLMAIFTVIGLLFSFHIGMGSDQISQKKLIAAGLIMFTLFCLGLVIFKTFLAVALLFVLGGLGHLIVKRAGETVLFKYSTHKNMGKEMAMVSVVSDMPFMIGIIIGAFIAQIYGFGAMFIVSAVLTVLAMLLLVKLKKSELFRFSAVDYFQDLKNKRVMFFFAIVFIFALHFGAEMVAYSPFLNKNLELDMIHISFFMAAAILFLVGTAIISGCLVDRKFNQMRILSYSMLVSGIGCILFAMTNNLVVSFIGRVLHETGDGGFLLMISVGIVSLFDKKRVGGNSGFVNVITIIASVVGALIFGPIGYSYGYQWPHIISGIFSILAFVMILVYARNSRKL